jgi:glutamate 5-kinase
MLYFDAPYGNILFLFFFSHERSKYYSIIMQNKQDSLVVVKIGTQVITKSTGILDKEALANIVSQISEIQKKGEKIILVSSGAMGAARSLIKFSDRTTEVAKRQVLAATGQIKLIGTYLEEFQKEGLLCAQVLATKDDFRSRRHYLNMKQCLEALLDNNIIPIVNENDVTSVEELMFTDNDELASLIASMMKAKSLIILSCIDGIYDRSPKDPKAKLIRTITPGMSLKKYIQNESSDFGRGGMLSKAKMAQKAANEGVETYIANGQTKDILDKVLNKKGNYSHFQARTEKAPSNFKRWLSRSEGHEKGTIHVNPCVETILKEKIASLLPIGITKIEGEFEKGDLVKIINPEGKIIGMGQVSYGDKLAQQYLGKKQKKALIHYNYLVLI